MKIYLDLDGTIVDFIGGYKKLTNMHIEHYAYVHGWDKAWKEILDYGEDKFWRNLEWTEWGQFLWDNVKEYHPVILTSAGRDQEGEAAAAKKDWVHYHLGDHVEVHCTSDKWKWANSDAILIDDSYKVREAFYLHDGNVINVYDEATVMTAVKTITNYVNGYIPKERRLYV